MIQTNREKFIETLRKMIKSTGLNEKEQVEYIFNSCASKLEELSDADITKVLCYVADYKECEPLREELIARWSRMEQFTDVTDEGDRYVSRFVVNHFLAQSGFYPDFFLLTFKELTRIQKRYAKADEQEMQKKSIEATKSLLKELGLSTRTPRKIKENAKSNKGTNK